MPSFGLGHAILDETRPGADTFPTNEKTARCLRPQTSNSHGVGHWARCVGFWKVWGVHMLVGELVGSAIARVMFVHMASMRKTHMVHGGRLSRFELQQLAE